LATVFSYFHLKNGGNPEIHERESDNDHEDGHGQGKELNEGVVGAVRVAVDAVQVVLMIVEDNVGFLHHAATKYSARRAPAGSGRRWKSFG